VVLLLEFDVCSFALSTEDGALPSSTVCSVVAYDGAEVGGGDCCKDAGCSCVWLLERVPSGFLGSQSDFKSELGTGRLLTISDGARSSV
jgi:hypothetical protein